MEFFRQEYWRGLPFLPSGDLPDPGIEPMSPALAGGFLITEPFRKPFFWGKDVNEAQHQAGLQMDCVLSAHSISSDAQQSKTEEGKMPLFLSPPQTTTTTHTHTHTHTSLLHQSRGEPALQEPWHTDSPVLLTQWEQKQVC